LLTAARRPLSLRCADSDGMADDLGRGKTVGCVTVQEEDGLDG
jgi:hypothetical protein